MSNPKLENLLNLALETPKEQREKSLNLNVGYEAETNSWEVIVKYNGDLDRLSQSGILVEKLIAGYAILTVPEPLLDALAELEEIEYVEKPKRLVYDISVAKLESCFSQVTVRPPFLSGKGCLVAVLDSGIQYQNPDFRREDGSSRILFLWDQSLNPDPQRGWYPPEGVAKGVEFSNQELNEALAELQENPGSSYGSPRVPSIDRSGHGTAVAGIAAGNGRAAAGAYTGAAPESELLIVKLGQQEEKGFPGTTDLMRGLWYVVQKAADLRRPVAINLSFGNTYGAHDGHSLLERFLDNVSEIGRNVVCVGSGNEGASAGHLAANVTQGGAAYVAELAVASYETSLNVQLWKNYADRFRVILYSPDGSRYEVPVTSPGKKTIRLEQTGVLLYVGEPRPYSAAQEIYFDLLPEEIYINSGIWRIEIIPEQVVTGNFYLYLPSAVTRNQGTGFFAPTPEVTLTIPSTAGRAITVGAYNGDYRAYADFSGRGYETSRRPVGVVEEGIVKPDLVAPGVGIMAPSLQGGYAPVTGTSFAVPLVTGAAALLMEWGIVQGNDPFLYGEKVKAYLRRGARQLPGYEHTPNAQTGYGALCLADSLPE